MLVIFQRQGDITTSIMDEMLEKCHSMIALTINLPLSENRTDLKPVIFGPEMAQYRGWEQETLGKHYKTVTNGVKTLPLTLRCHSHITKPVYYHKTWFPGPKTSPKWCFEGMLAPNCWKMAKTIYQLVWQVSQVISSRSSPLSSKPPLQHRFSLAVTTWAFRVHPPFYPSKLLFWKRAWYRW